MAGSRYTRRLLLLSLATSLALIVSELGLRVAWPQPLSGTWLTPSGRGYNVNKRSTSVRHVHAGRTAQYHLNSLGIRGAEPAPDGFRILAVGDSVTFGWLLSQEESYVQQISDRLTERFGMSRVQFLNGAVAGWGTADYTAYIEDSRDEVRPGAIVVFVGGDDVRRAWESPVWQGSGTGLMRAPIRDSPLDFRKVSRLPGYNFLIEHSHAAQLLRRTVVKASQRSAPVTDLPTDRSAGSVLADAAATRARRLFGRLTRWCAERNIPLLVVSGPSAAIEARNSEDPTQVFLVGAGAFFSEIGVPFLATRPFPDDSFTIPGDGHPNPRGATMIADLVSPWLLERIGELLAN